MTESKLIFLTDRSAVALDDRCGMKYWLNRKEGGRGIVPKKEALPLAIGRETHVDLATIAEMEDISPAAIQDLCDQITKPLTEDDRGVTSKMELVYRRLGWLAAFALYTEPMIREYYETLHIEHELILDRDPLWVAVTPDRVLRHKGDKRIEYREYKTTISSNSKWMRNWNYAIQMHLGIAAVQEELGQKVNFGQIMGLNKGYESAVDRRMMHPYVWGYYNHDTNEWGHDYDLCRSNKWIPMPVWEFDGGIVKWVQRLGPEVARMQFPHSQPVFLNERMLEEWVSRRIYRERIIASVTDVCREDPNLRALHFERRTDQCSPPFGDACPYLMACWNAEVAANPSAHADYIARVPHHDVELTLEP